jgi:hypothetical protein
MKTWKGITKFNENDLTIKKIEEKYKFNTDANPNKKFKGIFKETISRKFEQELFNLLQDKEGSISINTLRSLGNSISSVLSEMLNDSDLKFAIKNLISGIENSEKKTKIQYSGTKLK